MASLYCAYCGHLHDDNSRPSSIPVPLASSSTTRMPTQMPVPQPTLDSTEKPIVLVISLEMANMYQSICANLRAALRSEESIEVVEVSNMKKVMDKLNNPNNLRAVLLTEPNIIDKSRTALRNKIVVYAKNGGTLILACQFSSFITPPDFNSFIRTNFGLPWTFGNYYRSEFVVNLRNVGEKGLQRRRRLALRYSQKAVTLSGVPAGDVIYSGQSRGDDDTAVAFGKVGKGYLGYVGDVNAEDESTDVVLAMCGL